MDSTIHMKNRIKDEILDSSLNLFHLIKRGERIPQEKIWRIWEDLICKDPILRQGLNLYDIHNTFWNPTKYYPYKSIEKMCKAEFIDYLNYRLFTNHIFDFYFALYNFMHFPQGMMMGNLKVMDFNDLPEKVRDEFLSHWKNVRTMERSIEERRSRLFLHISIKTKGTEKAVKEANDIAEGSIDILRLIHPTFQIPLPDFVYIIKEADEIGSRISPFWLAAWLGSMYEADLVSGLTKVLQKENPNEMEKRIRRSLRAFGIQTSIPIEGIKIVMIMTALETLLVRERDYLGWKLAEKASFLLGRNLEKRIEFNCLMKNYYGKRSGYIHDMEYEPTKHEDLWESTDDIQTLQRIFVSILKKILYLIEEEEIIQIQKDPNKNSLDGYIERLKFGENKTI